MEYIMKFKFIKPDCKKVPCYGKKSSISTGDTIELTGHFAEKAKKNPFYEEVIESAAPEKTTKPKETTKAKEPVDASGDSGSELHNADQSQIDASKSKSEESAK